MKDFGIGLTNFFKANSTLGGLLSEASAAIKTLGYQYESITFGSAQTSQLAGIGTNVIVNKLKQSLLWGFHGRIPNVVSTELSFIPGNYGKVSASFDNLSLATGTTTSNNEIIINKDRKKDVVLLVNSSEDEINSYINKATSNTSETKERTFIYIKFKTLDDNWAVLKLKASIGHQKLRQSINNTWTPHSAYGRTQKNYIYSESESKLPLSLFEYATSKSELLDLYFKLNTLSKLNYGRLEKLNGVEDTLKSGSVIYITIGNLYKDLPCIITDMNFEFDEDMWDIDIFVPTMIKIDMQLIIVWNENKNFGSDFFLENVTKSLNDNNYTNNDYTSAQLTYKFNNKEHLDNVNNIKSNLIDATTIANGILL